MLFYIFNALKKKKTKKKQLFVQEVMLYKGINRLNYMYLHAQQWGIRKVRDTILPYTLAVGVPLQGMLVTIRSHHLLLWRDSDSYLFYRFITHNTPLCSCQNGTQLYISSPFRRGLLVFRTPSMCLWACTFITMNESGIFNTLVQ